MFNTPESKLKSKITPQMHHKSGSTISTNRYMIESTLSRLPGIVGPLVIFRVSTPFFRVGNQGMTRQTPQIYPETPKNRTKVWNMLHAWWSNRITLKTVLPLLEDARINQVHNKDLHQWLGGGFKYFIF